MKDILLVAFLSEDWACAPLGFTRRSLLEAIGRELGSNGGVLLCINRPVCPMLGPVVAPRKWLGWLRNGSQLQALTSNTWLGTPWFLSHERFAARAGWLADINRHIVKSQIDGWIRELGWARRMRMVLLFHPYQRSFAGMLGEEHLVYECHDDYGAYEKEGKKARLRRYENGLLMKASAVLTTSRALYTKCLQKNPNSFLVPNGVEDYFFSRADCDIRIPPDLASIPRPRVGFAGAINRELDFDLLLKLTVGDAGLQFVLIGPIYRMGSVDVRKLRLLERRPNVHILGLRPQRQVPSYLRGMDVLTMPMKLDAAQTATYPLKLNEYLAVGKPIVSTPFSSDLNGFADHIRLARFPPAFLSAIREGIDHSDPGRLHRGIQVASDNRWARRAERVCRILYDLAGGKSTQREEAENYVLASK